MCWSLGCPRHRGGYKVEYASFHSKSSPVRGRESATTGTTHPQLWERWLTRGLPNKKSRCLILIPALLPRHIIPLCFSFRRHKGTDKKEGIIPNNFKVPFSFKILLCLSSLLRLHYYGKGTSGSPLVSGSKLGRTGFWEDSYNVKLCLQSLLFIIKKFAKAFPEGR